MIEPKRKRWVGLIAVVVATQLGVLGCASSTMIRSVPSNAKLYLNGVFVGRTPYLHSDTRVVTSATGVTIKKEGYQEVHASFSRDEKFSVGACIGGVFVLVPFLWVMGYNPEHVFPMERQRAPAAAQGDQYVPVEEPADSLPAPR